MSIKKKIAVMDSGVGGLTIHDAIKKSIPDIDLVYEYDKENFPYGTKPEEVVNRISTDFAKKLYDKHKPDILVVACNTMSTVALQSIRDALPCPIIGVVPAIKPAAKMSKSKVIGLLATRTTVKQVYIDQLVREFAADCKVVRVGSDKLAQIAEDFVAGREIDDEMILNEIKPLFVDGLDVVVLGCTHFPHLTERFKRIQPWDVTWLDSTQAIVERVRSFI